MNVNIMAVPPVLAKLSITWPEGFWEWALYGGGFFAAVVLAIIVYIRDARKLSPIAMIWMLLLRLAVFATLAVIALNPHDKFIKKDFSASRVIVVVDRSHSMTFGEMSASTQSTGKAKGRNRFEATAALFETTALIESLRKNHDVTVYTFNSKLENDYLRIPGEKTNQLRQDESTDNEEASAKKLDDWKSFFNPERVSVSATYKKDEGGDEAKVSSALGSVNETRLGDILRGLIKNQLNYRVKNGKRQTTLSSVVVISDGQSNVGLDPVIANMIAQEHNIRLFTVGVGGVDRPSNVRLVALRVPENINKGNPYDVTAVLEGVGMEEQDVTVQLLYKLENAPDSDLKPVEGQKSAQDVTFQKFLPTEKGYDKSHPNRTKPAEVVFHIDSKDKGTYRYVARVTPKVAITESHLDDNVRSELVKVIERNLGVLIIAGGPMREYRFARNMLHRHEGINLDVWLQSADPGKIDQISQECDDLLTEFPAKFPQRPIIEEEKPQEDSALALKYDVVIAFDPNWTADDFKADSIKKLANWVSRKAGGLVIVAGDVNTPELAAAATSPVLQPVLKPILDMYPVVLNQLIDFNDEGDQKPEAWKIVPTEQGKGAKFLQLGENETESEEIWKEFEGFYRCYPTTGRKSGAVVYSYFSDPTLAVGDFGQPILLASQFYGVGRVLYLGSGEMWRLRSIDEEYYDRFWVKAVWEAGLGRMNQASDHGTVMLESKKYFLGQNVHVSAQLENAQSEPLTVDSVSMELIDPDGELVIPITTLHAVENQDGYYAGDFKVAKKGIYRLKVINPAIETKEDKFIPATLEVVLAKNESLDPRQDVKTLQDLPRDTGGRYFPLADFHDMFASITESQKQIEDFKEKSTKVPALKTEQKKLDEAEEAIEKMFPNRSNEFQVDERIETLWDIRFVMFLLVALLSIEWLTRKLLKLA